MGEPFYLTDVYYELNKIAGVLDTRNVRLSNKNGTKYSSSTMDIDFNLSSDGRFLSCPSNVSFEIKYPEVDITGVVR